MERFGGTVPLSGIRPQPPSEALRIGSIRPTPSWTSRLLCDRRGESAGVGKFVMTPIFKDRWFPLRTSVRGEPLPYAPGTSDRSQRYRRAGRSVPATPCWRDVKHSAACGAFHLASHDRTRYCLREAEKRRSDQCLCCRESFAHSSSLVIRASTTEEQRNRSGRSFAEKKSPRPSAFASAASERYSAKPSAYS